MKKVRLTDFSHPVWENNSPIILTDDKTLKIEIENPIEDMLYAVYINGIKKQFATTNGIIAVDISTLKNNDILRIVLIQHKNGKTVKVWKFAPLLAIQYTDKIIITDENAVLKAENEELKEKLAEATKIIL